jgi:hypothetical protein
MEAMTDSGKNHIDLSIKIIDILIIKKLKQVTEETKKGVSWSK